jgi:hypothetical protein
MKRASVCRRHSLCLPSFLALMALAGCFASKPPKYQPTKAEENLLRLGAAYRDASQRLQRGPSSLEELKPFLKKHGDPDEILKSPNDGEAFGIVWGLIPQHYKPGTKVFTVLAYERKGVAGKRYVLDPMLKVKIMNEKAFAHVEFPADHHRPNP